MLIVQTRPSGLKSYQAFYEFESSFPEDTKILNDLGFNKISRLLSRKIILNLTSYLNLFRFDFAEDHLFVILMNYRDLYKLFPYLFKYKRIHLYIYDLWPNHYDLFYNLIEKLKVKSVFFSSLLTANLFREKYNSQILFKWLPEAIKPSEYSFKPYENKNIDLLSFGRKHKAYHQKIISQVSDYQYLYKSGNKEIFSLHKDLAEALSAAKISICFPHDLTSPRKAQGVSKITMRYFQSMASKCLIVGKAPKELKELFNYNPLIEVDDHKPGEQIRDILNNYNSYIDLIEKNYQEVIDKHQYLNRVKEIFNTIS